MIKKPVKTVFGVALALALVAQANAITITYSVGGWGPFTYADGVYNGQAQPGDKIELQSYTTSLSLAANTPTVGKVNTLVFDVNYTWPTGQTPLTVSRSMTVAAVAGGISQTGLFDSWFTYNLDAIWLGEGATVTFDLGANGSVDVTPLAVSMGVPGGLDNGHYLKDVNASFVWRPVPDGGLTAMFLGMGLLGLGSVRRMVK